MKKIKNKIANKKIFNKRRYYIIIFIFLILLVSIIYLNKNSLKKQESIENFNILNALSLKKLVFNLPNMDKQMCETFPGIVLSTLEEQKGVVDASFKYENHVFTVYYVPEFISKEEILNNEVYAWVGTKFISEEDLNISNIEKIYKNRDNNNELKMPKNHMSNIDNIKDSKMMNLQDFPKLVSAEWLSKNNENVKIIEIGSVEEYNKGHEKGAININIEEIRTTRDGVAKQILSKEDFEILMKNKGISNNDRIVIYSSKSLTHASRLYLTFKYYGHKNVAMLDGGKYLIDKKSISIMVSPKNFTNYTATIDKNMIVNSDYILNKIGNPKTIILDVRSKQEFDQGHISGAINIDWNNFINADGTLKNNNELKFLLKEIDSGKEIIVYCVSGTRASYAWFVLSEIQGYLDIKLFDGSMIEWSYKQLPLEK